MRRVLHLDFETCNTLSLRSVGADVYSRSPTLIVTVLAWAFDEGPVESVTVPAELPTQVREHLKNGGQFKAWNASFEWAILTNTFGLELDPGQAVCTQQAALHSGLPASLDDAGPAIGARHVKDVDAHKLMMQLAKPRKITREGVRSYWHVDQPEKLEALRRYCARDVEAERAISKLITPLPKTEARVAAMDRAANQRGIKVDLELIGRFKALAAVEIEELKRECVAITDGAVTSPGTQTTRLKAWLESRGVEVPSLSKESVASALETAEELDLSGWGDPPSKRVLEIRQEIARASIAKLEAMRRCAGPDDRVRGQLAYYGAFRTGRFAGRLIQPQNFPRLPDKSRRFDPWSFIRHALSDGGPDPEWVRCAWGRPLEMVAWSLKACMVPSPGKAFVVYDLSQIEARMIAWLAGQSDILAVFGRGEDVYAYTQQRLGLKDRQAGKVAVLGLGFQMGASRFIDHSAKNGVTITLEQSVGVVQAWRDANPKITALWWAAGNAVMSALRDFAGSTIARQINDKLSATVSPARNGQPLLTLLLPSGRRLYYRNPRIMYDLKGRPQVIYDGVDPVKKIWGPVKSYGGKFTENMVQAAARDVIVEAALRIEDLGLGELVLSVHDELVFEVPAGEARQRSLLIEAEINRRPSWAPDLPVASEGGVRARYIK